MKISIYVYGRLKEFLKDEPAFEADEASDAASVLKAFAKNEDGRKLLFDASGVLRPQILLMVNQKRIAAKDAASCVLKDGDILKIYPAVSGG